MQLDQCQRDVHEQYAFYNSPSQGESLQRIDQQWVSDCEIEVTKQSNFIQTIHRVIRLWETGLLDKWRRIHLPNVDKCVKANAKKTSVLRLNLNNLSGIFILLGIGYGIAIVAFSGEKLAARVRYSRNLPRF